MIKNRNGYWMSPEFAALYAPDNGGGDGGAGGDNAPGGDDPGAGGEGAGNGGDGNNNAGGNGGKGTDSPDLAEQLAQLKAEMEKKEAEFAKQKAALDKATKEAGDARKALKAKMTQEEIDAANKEEEEKRKAQELEDLRKEVARAKNTKSVMSKLSVDEESAGKIAECLAGCEDIENALLLIQKTWEAKEKALRLEFGKIPGPGAGGGSEDKEMEEALRLAKELGERKASVSASVRGQLGGLVR